MDKASLETAVNSLTTKNYQLSTQVSTLDKERTQLLSELDAFTKTVNQKNAELVARNADITSLTNQLASRTEEIKSLQQEKLSVTTSLQSTSLDLQNYQVKLEEVETERSKLVGEVSSLQTQISGLKSQLTTATQGYDQTLMNLQKTSEDRLAMITQRDVIIAKLSDDISKITIEKTTLQSSLDKKAGLLSARNLEVAELNAKLSNEINSRNKLQGELDTSKASLSTLQQQLSVLNSDLIKRDADISFLSGQISEITAARDSFKASAEDFQSQRNMFEVQATTWQNKFAEVNSLYTTLKDNSGVAYKQLQDQVLAKEATLSILELERSNLLSERATLNADLGKYKQDLASRDGTITGLNENLDKVKKERDNFQSQFSVLTGLHNSILGERDSLKTSLNEKITAFAIADVQIGELKNQLTARDGVI